MVGAMDMDIRHEPTGWVSILPLQENGSRSRWAEQAGQVSSALDCVSANRGSLLCNKATSAPTTLAWPDLGQGKTINPVDSDPRVEHFCESGAPREPSSLCARGRYGRSLLLSPNDIRETRRCSDDSQTSLCSRVSRASRTSQKSKVSTCSNTKLADVDLDNIALLDSNGSCLSAPIVESSSDSELEELPIACTLRRRVAVSGEAFGDYNRRPAMYDSPTADKTCQQHKHLLAALQGCAFFKAAGQDTLELLAKAMPVESVCSGACIVKQGQHGDCGFAVLEGAADCYKDNEVFDPLGNIVLERSFVRTMPAGFFFGEIALLWRVPRTRSVYARGETTLARLTSDVYHSILVRHEMESRECREECLRDVKMLETLSYEQLSQIADALQRRSYQEGDVIIREGELGDEFFVVLHGECVVTVQTGPDDIQEHRRYYSGDLFGERALLQQTVRAATITATSQMDVLCLKRKAFERMLGPLQQLQACHYMSDPRKSIADFYMPGDQYGPHGARSANMVGTDECSRRTDWFAVYRPTSREAISRMISGEAVGKGLNIKGKSAKKNRLSGLVPFLQISNNLHKKFIEQSPPDARLMIFYSSEVARTRAIQELEPLLDSARGLVIEGERAIRIVNDWSGVYGIDLPEPVMQEAYIKQADMSAVAGWETGRQSEPAFMNMNLHAVRSTDEPRVVLYQFDKENPMNPHGLLLSYAEACVKPVVSDFDTFTVGSRGMCYTPLPQEQQQLALWSMDRTEEILRRPGASSWNSRWLEILDANEKGFHVDVPKYGFGDATSYRLIQAIVEAVRDSGAVRHGAECFNFYFPQELDEEYLIVWEGFIGKPWAYVCEQDLVDFLLARIEEDYCFPLNPVWAVRDEGWYDVFRALMESEKARPAMYAWYPPESGLVERIEACHRNYQDGFRPSATSWFQRRSFSIRSEVGVNIRRSVSSMSGFVRAVPCSSYVTLAAGAGCVCSLVLIIVVLLILLVKQVL